MSLDRLESSPEITIRGALCVATELADVSTSALLDCQILLADTLDKPRTFLYGNQDVTLTALEQRTFMDRIGRRLAGEPVAYIVGRKWFWDMNLVVSPDTLIPRPETESLVNAILARYSVEPLRLLDLATGSGAIAIALARERKSFEILASDVSRPALAIAEKNARQWAPGRIEFRWSDWLGSFERETFEVIACNPPYIRIGDEHLPALSFEPQIALVGGDDGLQAIHRVIQEARGCLAPGGRLFLEHGYDQRAQVVGLLEQEGYTGIETIDDEYQVPRVAVGRFG